MAKEVFREEMDELVRGGALAIDVRETGDDGETTLPTHVHVPLSRIAELADKVQRGRPMIFFCRSGVLSFHAAEIASRWTEEPVYYLSGGLLSADA
jgi:rhodanese-related sulfurtransferase